MDTPGTPPVSPPPSTTSVTPADSTEIPVSSLPPHVPPKKSRKILYLVIGLILFLGIVGSTGYYVLGTQKIAASVTPTLSVTAPQPTNDPKSDWKTYESSQYGFSFTYPDTLTIREDSTEELAGFLVTPGSNQSQRLVVTVTENPTNIFSEESIESARSIPDETSNRIYTPRKLNGYDALVLTYDMPYYGLNESIETIKGYSVFVRGNGHIITLGLDNTGPAGVTEEHKVWLESILETLKLPAVPETELPASQSAVSN